MDYGIELLRIIRLQRHAFVRTTDGKRLITNSLLYRQCEDGKEILQKIIGRENKRELKSEDKNCPS